MQAILYNHKFFIENYAQADDDDELYMNYDWSPDTLSVKSNMSGYSHVTDQDLERLSLAYEKLDQIPRKIAEKFSRTTYILDLSHNSFRDLSFLTYFRDLDTLILDNNPHPDEKTFPSLPNLTCLWLNHCDIENVQNWLHRIRDCCPNIRILSLMGNPGATSSFNGNSTLQHNDYRMMVLSILPSLTHLDDMVITSAQKVQAKQFRRNNYQLAQNLNVFEASRRGQQQQQQLLQQGQQQSAPQPDDKPEQPERKSRSRSSSQRRVVRRVVRQPREIDSD